MQISNYGKFYVVIALQAVEIDDSKHIIDTITPFETNAENEHSSTNGDSKKIEQNPTIQGLCTVY